MNLSRHFTLAELSNSNTAVAERIPNLPGDAERAQLAALCTQVLDPLREAVGQTVRLTSGYRGPALNARIRGSSTSQHLKGQAADIQAAAVSVLELFKMVIRLGLPFDQVIFEAKNATTKWVHVSHNPAGNRGEIRVAEFDASGRAVRYPRVSAELALAMVDRVTRSARPGAWPDYVETGDEPEHDSPGPAAAAVPAPVVALRGQRAARRVAAKPPSETKAAITKPRVEEPAAKQAAVKRAAAKTAVVKRPAVNKTAAKKAAVKKTLPKTTSSGQPAVAAAPKKAAARSVTAKRPASKAAPRRPRSS